MSGEFEDQIRRVLAHRAAAVTVDRLQPAIPPTALVSPSRRRWRLTLAAATAATAATVAVVVMVRLGGSTDLQPAAPQPAASPSGLSPTQWPNTPRPAAGLQPAASLSVIPPTQWPSSLPPTPTATPS